MRQRLAHFREIGSTGSSPEGSSRSVARLRLVLLANSLIFDGEQAAKTSFRRKPESSVFLDLAALEQECLDSCFRGMTSVAFEISRTLGDAILEKPSHVLDDQGRPVVELIQATWKTYQAAFLGRAKLGQHLGAPPENPFHPLSKQSLK